MTTPHMTEAPGPERDDACPQPPDRRVASEARLNWTKLSPEGKRERLLGAADSIFVECGLEASMPTIAERAAAGIGSVYRQFPSKVELIEAVVTRRLALIERVAADAAVSDDPPWPELAGMVWTLVARQVAAGFFADAWEQVADRRRVIEARRRANAEFTRLIERCRDEKAIRADATAEDIWLIFVAARGASRYDSDSWRRIVTLMLDGLKA